MRINKLVAQATGLSRRAADRAIQAGRVRLNGRRAVLGDEAAYDDTVLLDGKPVRASSYHTIMLNKPAGYVCSRKGQGSRTVYDLLPAEYHGLKPVGRLDKDSTGLLLLTNDGDLANRLTHPSYRKTKVYEVTLDSTLEAQHQKLITGSGVQLNDGLSGFGLKSLDEQGQRWQVTIREGRNRQIRRTFAALGHEVKSLHRTRFGDYRLAGLAAGKFQPLRAPAPSVNTPRASGAG